MSLVFGSAEKNGKEGTVPGGGLVNTSGGIVGIGGRGGLTLVETD